MFLGLLLSLSYISLLITYNYITKSLESPFYLEFAVLLICSVFLSKYTNKIIYIFSFDLKKYYAKLSASEIFKNEIFEEFNRLTKNEDKPEYKNLLHECKEDFEKYKENDLNYTKSPNYNKIRSIISQIAYKKSTELKYQIKMSTSIYSMLLGSLDAAILILFCTMFYEKSFTTIGFFASFFMFIMTYPDSDDKKTVFGVVFLVLMLCIKRLFDVESEKFCGFLVPKSENYKIFPENLDHFIFPSSFIDDYTSFRLLFFCILIRFIYTRVMKKNYEYMVEMGMIRDNLHRIEYDINEPLSTTDKYFDEKFYCCAIFFVSFIYNLSLENKFYEFYEKIENPTHFFSNFAAFSISIFLVCCILKQIVYKKTETSHFFISGIFFNIILYSIFFVSMTSDPDKFDNLFYKVFCINFKNVYFKGVNLLFAALLSLFLIFCYFSNIFSISDTDSNYNENSLVE